MNRKLALALSLGLLAALVAIDAAQAKWNFVVFSGTRAQVTNACNGNMELSQHIDGAGFGWSMCQNFDTGNVVICGDSGWCSGNWNDGEPDVTAYEGGKPRSKPQGKPLIAGSSLSESGTDSGTPAAPVPDDGGYDGPIYN